MSKFLDDLLPNVEKYSLYHYKFFIERIKGLPNEELEELYTNLLYLHFGNSHFNPPFIKERLEMMKDELSFRAMEFDNNFYDRLRMYVEMRMSE